MVTAFDFSSLWHSRAMHLEYFENIFRHYGNPVNVEKRELCERHSRGKNPRQFQEIEF